MLAAYNMPCSCKPTCLISAACLTVQPYTPCLCRWEGKVHKDPELLLIIKSRAALLEVLTQRVKEWHPYDEPEVVALPVQGGSVSYLKWVMDNTGAGSS
jgi:periplasmic divalent cation tolerance protein